MLMTMSNEVSKVFIEFGDHKVRERVHASYIVT